MKLLFLIIASENKLYNEIKPYLNKLYSNNEDIDFFYIYNNINLENDFLIKNKDIYFKEKESYIPGIFNKTIKSFNLLNVDKYDWIIRTNMSTFFYIPEFKNILSDKDKNNVYCPIVKRSTRYNDILFPVGFCIIMSSQIVKKILLNFDSIQNEKINEFKTFPDDVIFGNIFNTLQISMVSIQKNLIRSDEIYKILPNEAIIQKKCIFRNRDYLDNEERLTNEIKRWDFVIKHYI